MITVTIERISGDYGFIATDAASHEVRFDTAPDNGGSGFGIRPMQALLMALGTCSGIDIVSILKKQRQTVDGFRMQISGEREEGAEPSLWKKVEVIFILKGDIDKGKAERACALSIDKYCSVAETLRRAGAAITWRVEMT